MRWEQVNKDGTKTLNKREEMTKGAIVPGAAGALAGGAGLSAAYWQNGTENMNDKLSSLIDKRTRRVRGRFPTTEAQKRFFRKAGNKLMRNTPKVAALGALAGGLGAGAVGAGMGYLGYRSKRKVIQDHSLGERDKKRVANNRKIAALKEQRRYI